MNLYLLIEDLDPNLIRSVLLDFAKEVKPLPEDVPNMYEAYTLTTLTDAVVGMESELTKALETIGSQSSSVDMTQLVTDIWAALSRAGVPKTYEIKVLLLPSPVVALKYTTETFHEYYLSR